MTSEQKHAFAIEAGRYARAQIEAALEPANDEVDA